MTKKHGKDTFRRTKKNILHKKRVNSKKRGLRGGDPQLIIDPDRTLHGFRKKYAFTSLNKDDCNPWIQKVDEDEKKNKMNVKLVPSTQGYKDYYECLNVLDRYVSFNTTLSTKSNPPQTLNLKGCKAIKKPLVLERPLAIKRPLVLGNKDTPMFKYEIFSPAATTQPPSGGTQQNTHVGTFTQLSISQMLDNMTEGEVITQFDGIFHTSNLEGNALREDYFTCLEHVTGQFGHDSTISASISQLEKFRSVALSKLRAFGKSEECKIVFLAGNIGKEIQDPNNNGAIFVLPSQFNGAEYMKPEAVTDLNEYKRDFTGGPLGQLSCQPAVATFILKHAARTGFSSPFLEINAVDDVMETFSSSMGPRLVLNNGYLEVTNDTSFTLKTGIYISNITSKTFESFCQKLKVLQTDDVPTSGLTPANVYTSFNSEATSKVSLIYASAVPLNYNNIDPPINPEKSLLQYSVAGFDLVAQYFGAMVSAYHKKTQGKIKLFLTPLGGGVFQNPREMIACSVLLAYYMATKMLQNFDQKVEVIFLAWDSKDHEGKDAIRNGKKASVEDEDFSVFFKKDGKEPQALDSGLVLSEEQTPADDEALVAATIANPVISESSEQLAEVDPNPPNVLPKSIQSDDTKSSPSDSTKSSQSDNTESSQSDDNVSLPPRLHLEKTTLPETTAEPEKQLPMGDELYQKYIRLRSKYEVDNPKAVYKVSFFYTTEKTGVTSYFDEVKKNGVIDDIGKIGIISKILDQMDVKSLTSSDFVTDYFNNPDNLKIIRKMLEEYDIENILVKVFLIKFSDIRSKLSFLRELSIIDTKYVYKKIISVILEILYTISVEQNMSGGSKSQRRHRRHRKLVRKTRRGRGRTRKSKPKSKSKRHSLTRKHKKYTQKR